MSMDVISRIVFDIFKENDIIIDKESFHFLKIHWCNNKYIKIILKNFDNFNVKEQKEILNDFYNCYLDVYYMKILKLEEDYELIYLLLKIFRNHFNFYENLFLLINGKHIFPNLENIKKVFGLFLTDEICKKLINKKNKQLIELNKIKKEKDFLEKILFGKKIVKFVEKEMDDEFEMKPMRTRIDMRKIEEDRI